MFIRQMSAFRQLRWRGRWNGRFQFEAVYIECVYGFVVDIQVGVHFAPGVRCETEHRRIFVVRIFIDGEKRNFMCAAEIHGFVQQFPRPVLPAGIKDNLGAFSRQPLHIVDALFLWLPYIREPIFTQATVKINGDVGEAGASHLILMQFHAVFLPFFFLLVNI